jgi:hypothetical protein
MLPGYQTIVRQALYEPMFDAERFPRHRPEFLPVVAG